MRYLLSFLLASAAYAQEQVGILEDFACQIPAAITKSTASGQPTTVTCPSVHGFEWMRAYGRLQLTSAIDGATITIGSKTYRFVSTLSGCAANDILIDGTTAANNTQRLLAAINGDTFGWYLDGSVWKYKASGANGDWYCASTTAHPDVWAFSGHATSAASNYLHLWAQQAGASGETIALARSGTTNAWLYMGQYPTLVPSAMRTPSTLKRQWQTKWYSVGSDSWSTLATQTQPPVARVKNATQYELLYDSSAAGYSSLDQAAITSRGMYSRRVTGGSNPLVEQSPNAVLTPTYSNGSLSYTHPICTPETSAEICTPGFYPPDTALDYGATWFIQASPAPVASGGVLTMTLTGVSRLLGGGYVNDPAADVRTTIRGWQKYWRRGTPTFADNGSGITRVTTTSGYCVSGDQAYFAGVGGAGAPSGAYAITYVSTTQFDIPSKSYSAGWSGGTVTCNAEGRARVDEAYFMARNDSGQDWKQYRILSYDTGTRVLTLSIPNLPDGTYASITQSSTTSNSDVTNAWLKICFPGGMYVNIYPQMTSGSSPRPGPDSAEFHAKSWTGFSRNWDVNRAFLKWSKNVNHAGGGNIHFGTYNQSDFDPYTYSSHFYLFTRLPLYANRWTIYDGVAPATAQFCTNCWFSRSPFSTGMANTSATPAYPGKTGRRDFSFWHQNGTYYLTEGYTMGTWPKGVGDYIWGLDGVTTTIGALHLVAQPDDVPKEWVRNRGLVWAPERYVDGTLTATPGYHFVWGNALYEDGWQFRLRYSTTGSMRLNGWASGTDGGTVTQTDSATAYYGWLSPEMDEQDLFYVAVRPLMRIIGASGDGENKWYFFRHHTALSVGDSVTVSGAGGNRDETADVAEVLDHQYYWLDSPADGSAGNPMTSWGAGQGELLNIVASGGTCTANFRNPHNLKPGHVIRVSGTTATAGIGGSIGPLGDSTLGQWVFRLSSVGSTTAVWSCPGTPNNPYASNLTGWRMVIHAFPAVRIAGTATGAWTTSGTMENQEDTKGFVEMHYPRNGYTGEVSTFPPPNAPTALSATTTGETEITLGWTDNSTDESRFEVERKTGAGGAWSMVHQTAADAVGWVNAGLSGPQTYYYRVRACNNYGCSAYSNESSAAIAGPPVLAIETPSLPAATAGVLYTAALQASGGTAPYSWSITASSCGWMSVSGSSLTGTPPAPGSCSVSVEVEDAAAATESTTYNVSIAGTTLTIRSATAQGQYIRVVVSAPGLHHSVSCSAAARAAGVVVGQATVATGPATRILYVPGTASTTHDVWAECGGLISPEVQVTTGAALTGTGTLSVAIGGSRWADAQLQYSYDGSDWTSGSEQACATGCSWSISSVTRGPVYWRVLRRQSSTTRQTSAAQAVVIQ